MTRAGDGMPVVRVVWDGRKLRQGVREGRAVEQIVGDSVRVETVGCGEYSSRFFEVNVRGIARYAAGAVMDVAAVRKFIGESCPVPFRCDFPYRRKIAKLLGGGVGPFTLDVRIDGEEEAVMRPHRGVLDGEEGGLGDVVELEEVEIGGLGGVDGAVGWIGHTGYGGAIGKGAGVRGLRARVGNMQIGGEGILIICSRRSGLIDGVWRKFMWWMRELFLMREGTTLSRVRTCGTLRTSWRRFAVGSRDGVGERQRGGYSGGGGQSL